MIEIFFVSNHKTCWVPLCFVVGYHLAEILTIEDYYALKNYSVSVGSHLWTGLYMSNGNTECTNATCSDVPLIWLGSGEAFVYQNWMTGGIYYEGGAKKCVTFEIGKHFIYVLS